MIIPGCLISLLTFPGVIVHELGHLFMCRLLGVEVYKVCYFRLGNPAGYVIHDSPRTAIGHLLIAFGPLIVNTVAGALIALTAVDSVFYHHHGNSLKDALLIWLGVTIAMHSFPSVGDARSLWDALWRRGSCLSRLLVLPFVALIYLGALGSMFWLNLAYGVAVVLLASSILAKLL